MQIHFSTLSVILNVMATQSTCSYTSVHHPHWLVQWSHHYSCVRIPVHSAWLPGYIDVMQTILVTWLDFFQTDLVFKTLVVVSLHGVLLWTTVTFSLYLSLKISGEDDCLCLTPWPPFPHTDTPMCFIAPVLSYIFLNTTFQIGETISRRSIFLI